MNRTIFVAGNEPSDPPSSHYTLVRSLTRVRTAWNAQSEAEKRLAAAHSTGRALPRLLVQFLPAVTVVAFISWSMYPAFTNRSGGPAVATAVSAAAGIILTVGAAAARERLSTVRSRVAGQFWRTLMSLTRLILAIGLASALAPWSPGEPEAIARAVVLACALLVPLGSELTATIADNASDLFRERRVARLRRALERAQFRHRDRWYEALTAAAALASERHPDRDDDHLEKEQPASATDMLTDAARNAPPGDILQVASQVLRDHPLGVSSTISTQTNLLSRRERTVSAPPAAV